MLPEIMYGKNVGMIQSRYCLSLLLKSTQSLRSRANVEERIFTATSRFSLESRARYTSPIPPAPMGN